MLRMLLHLLVVLPLLLSTFVCENIEYALEDETSEVNSNEKRDTILSNESTEENPQTETGLDLESTTATTLNVSEALKEVNANNDLEGAVTVDCGNPPAVEHAQVEGGGKASYELGAELKYSCEFGYSTDGANHLSRCVREDDKSIWTDPGIACIPMSCGDPGFVLHAQRIGSRFTFPNQVSFECDDGYEMKGSVNIRYCQVNGKWSGSLPSCEKVFCDQPLHPDNGRVIYSSLEYGSRLKYECEKGFILKNYQTTRVCSENGTWSEDEPLCLEAQCDQPNVPEQGSVEVVGGNLRVGSIAIFKCETGRRLVGSATSKCLETGDWTFPAPKCVEPCVVPNVEHGTIGRYEKKTRWSRQKIYTLLSVGIPLKDGEELYLRCDDKYEPMGNNKQEEKVICEKGFWLETPTCVPAKCQSNPPGVPNTTSWKSSRNHGDYVVYFCKPHFKKKIGNVTCQYGTWKGVPPICSDRNCYVDKIQFPGLLKKRKNMFRNGEKFTYECEEGYNVAEGSGGKLLCEDGTWKGIFPPCTAANCATSPPAIQNGKIYSYSGVHSSAVIYECDEHFFLQKSAEIRCLFGKWTGAPPTCKESRCYFQDLKQKRGMVAPLEDPVVNGETISVKCATGYSLLTSIRLPFCSNGQWMEYGTSPCTPNNCVVERILNGAFTQRRLRERWTFKGRVSEYEFRQVQIGSMVPEGGKIFISCTYGHSFQGGKSMDVQIDCSEGKWKPTPVCIPFGTYYQERKENPATGIVTGRTSNQFKTSSTSPDHEQPSSMAVELDFEPTEGPKAEQKNVGECYCLYQGLDELVAYSGHQMLKSGSKVKENASVKFYCKHFGFHRFLGPRELVCKNCETWHSSEYPSCVVPVRGDVVFEFDDAAYNSTMRILPGGILSIDPGTDIQLRCKSLAVYAYPSWSSTANTDAMSIFDVFDEQNGQSYYYKVLSIHDADSRHNGIYGCSLAGKRSREIQICVRTKCKKFDESEEYNVHYDNKQEVNSSALFTCKKSEHKIEGPNMLTCLLNGEWSGNSPTCVPKGCPKLPDTSTVLITYSHELRVGSTATFHCFSPRVRIGHSHIKCLPNGNWSSTAPSCTVPRCRMDKLFDHIPENVEPLMEDVSNDTVPHGFELRLTCAGDLRLTEQAVAKCGNNGTWEVPKISCVAGCAPIPVPPGSSLRVIPERDFYRFGEYVSLECDNPEHVLSVEVEVVMCLRNGWSETVLPTCVQAIT